jgi:hypothetical protein
LRITAGVPTLNAVLYWPNTDVARADVCAAFA